MKKQSAGPRPARAGPRRRSAPHPLDVVYAQAGIAPPATRAVPPERIPSPYRGLLVHENDMTVTLEAHYGGPSALRALSVFTRGRSYYRRVLLVQEYSGRPIEMGAVRIDLGAFPRRVSAEIVRGRVPLGRLLRDGGIDYRSRPRLFLEVTPNPEIMGAFWMREARTLYGRQTEVGVDGRKVGDIVEILPLA